MPHHIYQTEGIVLASYPHGEGNALVSLLTAELGFVRAAAQAGREERSRMRYALQPHTRSALSLVRGREVWRITGAQPLENYHAELLDKRGERLVLERLVTLACRLLYGEGRNDYLYESVRTALDTLARHDLPHEKLNALEALTSLRLLYALGYVSIEENRALLSQYVDSPDMSPELLAHAAHDRARLRARVKSALEASHL